jgi:hypothetical protein
MYGNCTKKLEIVQIVDILLKKWFPLQGGNFSIRGKSNEDISLLPPLIPLVISYHSYKKAPSTSKKMFAFFINLINTRIIRGIQAFIMSFNKKKNSWKNE